MIMSSQATVRPSTIMTDVWGGEGLQTNQHTSPPRPVSHTTFKKQQGEGTGRGAHPALHTGSGLSLLRDCPAPQGAPPPRLGTFQLALGLAAGPRLFGAWSDFPSCSSRCLFMKMTLA